MDSKYQIRRNAWCRVYWKLFVHTLFLIDSGERDYLISVNSPQEKKRSPINDV